MDKSSSEGSIESPAFVKVESNQPDFLSDQEMTIENKEDNLTSQIQVIDEHQAFSEELTHYMKDVWQLDKCGFNYNLVAVFGSQSTGKSTLLNALFKTKFDTMGERYRQQTTKGLWVSLAKDSNTLVMDVEGVDGRERGEDQDFERKSALFSLAVAQVLIVNLWENQIGLYNGANMGLLKTVFEVNLELFQQKGKGKTLLFFVIRDHIGKVPLSHLSETLKQDLQRCWNELAKPKGLENSSITDFFDFMFFGLPHKVLLPEEFDEQTQILKQCFYDPSHPNYVFRPQYHKRIPADGFKVYAESIWEQIITNKNLDLPTQQQLLAQFRCDEIASSINSEVHKEFKPYRDEIDSGKIVADLGKVFNEIKSTALNKFDDEAGRYNKEVYSKKRSELEEKIHDYFHGYFKAQLDGLSSQSYSNFTKVIEQGLKQVDYDFVSLTTKASEEAKKTFNDLASGIVLKGADWAFVKEQHSLEENISDFITNKRQGEMVKLEQNLTNSISNQFVDTLSPLFNNAKEDLWPNVLKYYKDYTDSATKQLKDRCSAFNLNDEEIEKNVAELRVKSWETLIKHIKDEVADTMLLAKLRYRLEENFRYDADGLPRVWKPEDDIDYYFKTAKNLSLELIPLLSKIEFDNSFNPDTFFDGATTNIDFHRSLNVVSHAKINDIEARFKREADALFLEAKRSIVSTTAKVPYWVIGLILVLGWNEIMYVLSTPMSFLFLIFGGVAFYAVWTLKLIGPLTRVIEALVREVYNQTRKALEESVKNQEAIPLRPMSSKGSEMLGSPTSSDRIEVEHPVSPVQNMDSLPGTVEFDD
ncbi:root hair defective 3 GTP-binding protein [Neoconidiobolus thromboides FSU 785]|nr:root hair defective 3 GTP-binding protein [Neoconidiobolus thromboides FSU 785]